MTTAIWPGYRLEMLYLAPSNQHMAGMDQQPWVKEGWGLLPASQNGAR